MEDLTVKGLAQSSPEISESGLTWQMGVPNAGIEPIMFSLFSVMDRVEEGLHIGCLLKVAEQLDEKQGDGVIGKATETIFMCHDRADEGKIHQGGYKPSQTPYYTAIGVDFNVSSPVGILR